MSPEFWVSVVVGSGVVVGCASAIDPLENTTSIAVPTVSNERAAACRLACGGRAGLNEFFMGSLVSQGGYRSVRYEYL